MRRLTDAVVELDAGWPGARRSQSTTNGKNLLGKFSRRRNDGQSMLKRKIQMNPLRIQEDEIGRKLEEARKSGELRSAESYGKPMLEDTAWQQTPEEFRMGFKILKNANVVPPEIELLQQRAVLRDALHAATEEHHRVDIRKALSELEQKIAIRLESLRSTGSL